MPAQEAWRDFAASLPWLNASHRSIVGIASMLSGRLREGTISDSAANLLRQCLGQMGATPADASKVGWSEPDGEQEDSADEFFG